MATDLFRSLRLFVVIISLGFSSQSSSTELIVSAAASLTDVFRDLIKLYEQKTPRSKVLLNLGGSGALLQQIYKGAPVDVYASANMTLVNQAISREALIESSIKIFASNALVLVTPNRTNSVKISSLSDIANAGIKRVAVANYGVPVGRYTIDTLKKIGFWTQIENKVINTNNVRQALSYVLRGEVDAGFVYRTDAATEAERIKVIEVIPTSEKIVYPIGITQNTEKLAQASHFVDFIFSDTAQELLQIHGFVIPR